MQTAKYPYLFVITYGRSGSTLLQGILNAVPGYCIRGENNGVMIQLRNMHLNLATAHKQFSNIGTTPEGSWYGIADFDKEQNLEAIRKFAVGQLLRPPEGTRCMGFKEIRYARPMIGDLAQFLAFMRNVFPGAGFVFNSRNLDAVIKSGWWKDHPDPVGYLQDFEANMRSAFKQHADHSFWVSYDDYVADPESLGLLFQFLDEPFQRSLVMDTLSVRHSG